MINFLILWFFYDYYDHVKNKKRADANMRIVDDRVKRADIPHLKCTDKDVHKRWRNFEIGKSYVSQDWTKPIDFYDPNRNPD